MDIIANHVQTAERIRFTEMNLDHMLEENYLKNVDLP